MMLKAPRCFSQQATERFCTGPTVRRNPKSECRNTKQIRNSKKKTSGRMTVSPPFFHSDFVFVSDFDIRISDFVLAFHPISLNESRVDPAFDEGGVIEEFLVQGDGRFDPLDDEFRQSSAHGGQRFG